MRLTEKRNNEIGYGYKEYSSESSVAITQKLGQLEDIEEELGIDLITFFKYMFADKFYVKDKYLGIVERLFWSISRNYVEVVEEKYPYGDCTETLNFKDYGKTWALTKEELL